MRRYPQWDELKGFHRRLLTTLNESPGVLSAALTSSHPLDAGWTNSFQIQGREAEVSSQGEMSTRLVSDDYFATAGVRLLEGRLLPRHTGSEAPSLVLNKVAALRYFPEGNALGQRIAFWGVEREVVGVVDNERIHGLKDEVPPAMYGSIHLLPTIGATTLMVRTDRDPRLLIDTVRRVVEALDPEVALYDVVTMEKTVAESLARERFTTALLSLFAGVALALALVGVYSVLSNLVAQRRHEVGVRLTVGAGSLQILGLIVRQGMALATLGMALGLVASLVLSRFLSHLLYGIGPLDPLAYLLAIGALALTALLACLIPARRASKIDPVSAIRSQ
jgi:predicted permease